MKKELKKIGCSNKAEFILPWGGKLLSYCEIHANEICSIAKVIGSPIQVKRINTKEYCESLVNLNETND